LLGRRDDDRPVRVGDFLGDAEGLVARPRREIDHQVVQVSPLDVGKHLLERLDLQRTAPDDRRVAVDQLGHRDDLDARGAERRFHPVSVALTWASWTPMSIGMSGPVTSASTRPTMASSARTHARFADTVDFPTPPFPDITTILCLIR